MMPMYTRPFPSHLEYANMINLFVQNGRLRNRHKQYLIENEFDCNPNPDRPMTMRIWHEKSR
jgi:hypothetical protein